MIETEATVSAREIAEQNLILLSVVGSTAHGLNLPGTDDRDLMGVCLEPPSHVIGLRLFEQDVFRSKPEGVRSEAGDTDRTIYGARKFCRLALGGNPSILTLLYADPLELSDASNLPADSWQIAAGGSLLELAPAFSARSAGKAFLGYMTQQRQRLLGERGQMNVKRPELVEEHGYDTKYAMHMLRLGYQGVEFLETGRLTLPMREEEREFVYAVRTGGVSLSDTLTRAGELERRVEDLLLTSPLPAKPDHERVNAWLIETYQAWWQR